MLLLSFITLTLLLLMKKKFLETQAETLQEETVSLSLNFQLILGVWLLNFVQSISLSDSL